MKRLLVVLPVSLTLFSLQASAQGTWGITGGINLEASKFEEVDIKARTGWNLGLIYSCDLPLGFSVQPSLVYHQKGMNVTEGVAQNMSYIEVPVSVQWGPDLLLFRPFLDATPYIGYAVSNQTKIKLPGVKDVINGSWEGKERLEYGLGLGAGISIWKLQFIARYNWSFGSVYNVEGWDYLKEQISGIKKTNDNFGGVTLSLALLF